MMGGGDDGMARGMARGCGWLDGNNTPQVAEENLRKTLVLENV